MVAKIKKESKSDGEYLRRIYKAFPPKNSAHTPPKEDLTKMDQKGLKKVKIWASWQYSAQHISENKLLIDARLSIPTSVLGRNIQCRLILQVFLKACIHYHPDKQDVKKHGKGWEVFCGEVVKTFTNIYERYKLCD